MKRTMILFTVFLLTAVLSAGSVSASETAETLMHADGDYSYLFERGSQNRQEIALGDVERVAILFTSSPLPQSLFLDIEDMKSYYDPGRDIYYNIQISKYITDLSDSELSEIERIWQKADFANWDFYYEGTTEMDYECHFAVETKDSVYHYEIKGIDAAAPDSLMDLITDLLHEFWDPEIMTFE